MATILNINLTWRNVDTTDLTSDQLAAYEAYKSAQRTAAQLRDAFEAKFSADLGFTDTSPSRIVFGYKFGKLSIAVAPNDKPRKAKATTSSSPSLAAFLATHGSTRSI